MKKFDFSVLYLNEIGALCRAQKGVWLIRFPLPPLLKQNLLFCPSIAHFRRSSLVDHIKCQVRKSLFHLSNSYYTLRIFGVFAFPQRRHQRPHQSAIIARQVTVRCIVVNENKRGEKVWITG